MPVALGVSKMYRIAMTITVDREIVSLQSEMWEIDDNGDAGYLGEVPEQRYLGASRGHDWYGDALETLRKWSEMSLF